MPSEPSRCSSGAGEMGLSTTLYARGRSAKEGRGVAASAFLLAQMEFRGRHSTRSSASVADPCLRTPAWRSALLPRRDQRSAAPSGPSGSPFQESTSASWRPAPASRVSTDQLSVPEVLFTERLLQRKLFSKHIPVNCSRHDRKRCGHPCVARDKGGSQIEQGPTDIHRVAADGVGSARNECGRVLYVDTGSGSHRRCRDRNASPD